MSTFIEVFSIEKNTKVIINLDSILEIAPLREGGCNLFFPDAAAVGGKNSMKVTDSYTLFLQFALQTVSPDDIAAKIQTMKPQEERRGPGRPPKQVMGNTTAGLE
jgi:hypothetical protein